MSAIDAGLIRTMEDALSVLRDAGQPLGPMGAEWLERRSRSSRVKTDDDAVVDVHSRSPFLAGLPGTRRLHEATRSSRPGGCRRRPADEHHPELGPTSV